MTYIEFLIFFLIIPILFFLVILRKYITKPYIIVLISTSLIAFIATSFWDNYAVYSNIWMFPPEKTLGIYFWYVPLEEYCFFFLQTYLTGLLQYFILFKYKKLNINNINLNSFTTVVFCLIILNFSVVSQEEIIKLPFGKFNYIFHLFSWAGFFILIQFIAGWKKIINNIKIVILPVLIMTLYFAAVDSIAIGNGIWYFDPEQTLGFKIGNVPLEEILFFFCTNLLVTECIVLLLPEKYLLNNKNNV
ncbi:MAG TPA: lycopene cyclase domain-containing protein [Ignavibacteria bacterium]|nr:lycopene cyclase domain-containing protein [Ignavibacteria bacterium]